MNLYFPVQSPANQPVKPSGHWLLQTNRAITVVANSGGKLHIARGQVWATLGSAHGNPYPWRNTALEPCAMLKDYFLNAGDTLVVPPRTRVVMESMGHAKDLPVAFDWNCVPKAARVRQTSRSEVVLAAGQLGDALGQVGRALRRLMGAVLVSPKHAQRLETCT